MAVLLYRHGPNDYRPLTGGSTGVTDHGALTGLTPDDDHPQYHTDARGDARYLKQSDMVWSVYTPTVAGMTVGNGAVVGRFTTFGKTMHFAAKVTFGSTSAMGSTEVSFTLPDAFQSTFAAAAVQAMLLDSGNTWFTATALLYAPSKVGVFRVGTGGAIANFSTTTPFTWAVNDAITVSGTYERA